jgi:uncharacterized protein YbcC (UPF0753/DUF2309 family)
MINQHNNSTEEVKFLNKLRHFLPAQAPLKDFIHHNSLHAFQTKNFFDALNEASEIFGYRTYLSLAEYRQFFNNGRISKKIINKIITDKWKGSANSDVMHKLLIKDYNESTEPRIGRLRDNWKSKLHFDIDGAVHPLLFRILCSYTDQGISAWPFPYNENGLLESIRDLEQDNLSSIFNTKFARRLLFDKSQTLSTLLKILVGDEHLFEQYVFDQQFAHHGWSGMVSNLENNQTAILEQRTISLADLIKLELLLEIDALEDHYKGEWKPLSFYITEKIQELFSEIRKTELSLVYETWQLAFEWSYYDQVLFGIANQHRIKRESVRKSFQALFCIDDREGSLRRYIEYIDVNCETFGTAGFFNIEFYFKPVSGKFYTKLCPAPVNPKFLIKEIGSMHRNDKEILFNKQSSGLFSGWIIAQTLGFWSAVKLFANIFQPSFSPATASSLKHMNKNAKLLILNKNGEQENGLQIGFKIEEMVDRIENLFRTIGLTQNFSSIIYLIGHGSSSVNNPHYSAYDCGACSGKPGSVNARVFSYMANLKEVRHKLSERGICIPEETKFLGALHDTTRDEIVFYDENSLDENQSSLHQVNIENFRKALAQNAKERSRRFSTINTKQKPEVILEQVKKRSVTIFEPRPELNHATNAVCVVGSRDFTRDIFLDRRSFFNSYDYTSDLNGDLLFGILKAVAPVCGGINLEYYFSRVDNQKLGAGSKLPHNVMGLIGVANGTEGDLRPGLPKQMIEIHEPLRLLVVVEQNPDIVLSAIKRNELTYEWFLNNWINLVCVHPVSNELFLFENGKFDLYNLITNSIPEVTDLNNVIEESDDSLPVMILKS